MGKGAPPRRNVAIFLDVENLFGGYHRDVTGVQLGKVVRGIEQILGASGIGEKTALVRAYANWARADMAVYRREVLEHGIKPVQIFSFEKNVKNAADIELCVEVLEVAQDSPWVDVFVIVTGDGGFVPLIRRLHSLNKYVVVVSTTAPNSGIVNPLLKSVADEYHQIDVQGAPWALGVVPPDPVAVQPPRAVCDCCARCGHCGRCARKGGRHATCARCGQEAARRLTRAGGSAKIHPRRGQDTTATLEKRQGRCCRARPAPAQKMAGPEIHHLPIH
ncbi:MAG: NYN domain-containing protein [Specibacter sp.]